ncbi:hypothetical protein EXIGLDRAFT_810418 [Exidia glandulosa HHB12029]|uniref:Retrotransposon gag domain-containing protein n=1 Tax=Exidia glandulosa HHB12029 TaxID=1314781 RepID=A0A165LJU1_EXIGL|nr:hypothetical protein EXIGLDRAFT_810418 [Exidia glandulosa HHB12029]
MPADERMPRRERDEVANESTRRLLLPAQCTIYAQVELDPAERVAKRDAASMPIASTLRNISNRFLSSFITPWQHEPNEPHTVHEFKRETSTSVRRSARSGAPTLIAVAQSEASRTGTSSTVGDDPWNAPLLPCNEHDGIVCAPAQRPMPHRVCNETVLVCRPLPLLEAAAPRSTARYSPERSAQTTTCAMPAGKRMPRFERDEAVLQRLTPPVLDASALGVPRTYAARISPADERMPRRERDGMVDGGTTSPSLWDADDPYTVACSGSEQSVQVSAFASPADQRAPCRVHDEDVKARLYHATLSEQPDLSNTVASSVVLAPPDDMNSTEPESPKSQSRATTLSTEQHGMVKISSSAGEGTEQDQHMLSHGVRVASLIFAGHSDAAAPRRRNRQGNQRSAPEVVSSQTREDDYGDYSLPMPMYDGTEDFEKFESFVHKWDSWARVHRLTEFEAVDYLTHALTGSALDWYMLHVALSPRYWTIIQLYQSLYEYIFPSNFRQTLRRRLMSAKQHGRRVKDFAKDIENLSLRFPDVSSYTLKCVLWDGVDPYIRMFWMEKGRSLEFDEYDTLVAYAVRAENRETERLRFSQRRKRHEILRPSDSDSAADLSSAAEQDLDVLPGIAHASGIAVEEDTAETSSQYSYESGKLSERSYHTRDELPLTEDGHEESYSESDGAEDSGEEHSVSELSGEELVATQLEGESEDEEADNSQLEGESDSEVGEEISEEDRSQDEDSQDEYDDDGSYPSEEDERVDSEDETDSYAVLGEEGDFLVELLDSLHDPLLAPNLYTLSMTGCNVKMATETVLIERLPPSIRVLRLDFPLAAHINLDRVRHDLAVLEELRLVLKYHPHGELSPTDLQLVRSLISACGSLELMRFEGGDWRTWRSSSGSMIPDEESEERNQESAMMYLASSGVRVEFFEPDYT